MAFVECAVKVFIECNFQTMMVISRMAIRRVRSSGRVAYGPNVSYVMSDLWAEWQADECV